MTASSRGFPEQFSKKTALLIYNKSPTKSAEIRQVFKMALLTYSQINLIKIQYIVRIFLMNENHLVLIIKTVYFLNTGQLIQKSITSKSSFPFPAILPLTPPTSGPFSLPMPTVNAKSIIMDSGSILTVFPFSELGPSKGIFNAT